MDPYLSYIEDLSFGIPFQLSCSDPEQLLASTLAQARQWIESELTARRVYVDSSAEIHHSVTMEGPIYVGARVQVGPGAHLRPFTVLGDDCVVGHGAEIKGSVCLGGSKMQSNSFSGDSLLGQGARVASGVVLANRRFDQQPVKSGSPARLSESAFLGCLLGDFARIGANAICAPGTMIGRHTWIGGLVHAYGVIEPNKLIMLRQDWDISDKPPVKLS